MLRLIFDTSTQVLGMALTKGTEPIAEETIHDVKNHSKYLMPQIDKLMQQADVKPEALDAIVVAEGPGSYTGVRLGVTVAKTLAWTLQIPLYAVSSLQGMAQSYQQPFEGLLVPIIDARRGTVFTGAYRQQGTCVCNVLPDRHIAFDEWLLILQERDLPIRVIGKDSKLYQNELDAMLEQAVDEDFDLRVSKYIFLIKDINPVNIHHFSPKYLRLAEAEQKWLEQGKGMNG